jgi:hypothetical protein
MTGLKPLSWAGHRALREFAERGKLSLVECWELDQRYFAVLARREWIVFDGKNFAMTKAGREAFDAFDKGLAERRKITSPNMRFAHYFDPLHLGIAETAPRKKKARAA